MYDAIVHRHPASLKFAARAQIPSIRPTRRTRRSPISTSPAPRRRQLSMSTGLRCSHLSRPTRAGSACAWLGRWLLVLVLAVDLIGAPLHAHAHDSGVDGHAWAPHVDAPGWDSVHAEDADDALLLRHATLTMRASIAAPDLGAVDDAASVVPAWWPPFDGALAVAPTVVTSARWAARPPPPWPVHRSLPPAGRAPPLRA